jgi:stage V sporulation protein R
MTLEFQLPSSLRVLQDKLEVYARDFNLDFPEVRFHMLDWETMNAVAALGGFFTRYPHWRFGMEYNRLSRSYAYGLHRIYEMVINTVPCHAYLLSSNQLVDHKLVMLHVFGHADFFKNNFWFTYTNRRMLDEMANHASRIRRYVGRYGQELVEKLIDHCLSIDDLIDVHSVAIKRHDAEHRDEEDDLEEEELGRIPAKSYMDGFINPPEYLEAQQAKRKAARLKKERVPEEPERDVMNFLLNHAPLKNWERDVLDIIREESYYFAPQGQTKIMNEGWAVFCHTHLMTEKALTADEVIDYADHHSGTVALHQGRLNPYRIGFYLFKDIEERWNRGMFGPEWDNCDDMKAREEWNRELGLGREKVFEVRRIFNDIGFIDEFLTPDFARRQNLFGYRYRDVDKMYVIDTRDFDILKKRILFQLTNFGRPVIDVVDSNYENRGELYLMHRYEGVELDKAYALETLAALFNIWKRPVHIETKVDEGKKRMLYGHKKDGPCQKVLD